MNRIRISELAKFIPLIGGIQIDWPGLENSSSFGPIATEMKKTEQNPLFHGEGSVYAHTKLVVQAMVSDKGFRSLTERERAILFCAALLHDMGKPSTTVMVENQIHSPFHSVEGARMAGQLIIVDSFCDPAMKRAICLLIRYHMVPNFLMNRNPDQRDRKIQNLTQLMENAPNFNWKFLLMLCESDTKGRIANDCKGQSFNLDELRLYLISKGLLKNDSQA